MGILTRILFFAAVTLFGFDVSRHSVPLEEIQSGGPPRDGIPSLTAPEFVTAVGAGFLKDSDRVIGVELDGVSKAYPVRILNWHEAVNDTVGKTPVLVTW